MRQLTPLCARCAGVRIIYGGNVAEANAISLCCASIVVTSVVLGATLPFAIRAAGFDPAHAGATIQVRHA